MLINGSFKGHEGVSKQITVSLSNGITHDFYVLYVNEFFQSSKILSYSFVIFFLNTR